MLRRASALTAGYTALILLCNFATGVLVARYLHASGRGEFTAIVQFPNMATWLFGMGAAQALSYFIARDETRAAGLFTAWLVYTVPLALIAIGVAELVLPVLLHAQSPETLLIARWWAFTVVLAMYAQVAAGVSLGLHRFHLYNLCSFLYPALMLTGFVLMIGLGTFTVRSALACALGASCVQVAVNVVVLAGAVGLRRPSWLAARQSLMYGAKAHFGTASSVVTFRLDILIMPAILSAVSVGLYSVATNVSWIIVTLIGSIAPIILPVAARLNDSRTVIRTVHAVAAAAAVLVVIGEIVAPIAIRLVYGQAFLPAVPALRILLPGSLFLVLAQVFWAGTLAKGRPLATALSQIPGAIITVVGLLLFLKAGGIVLAAEVSTVAYGVVAGLAGLLYARAAKVRLRDLLDVRGFAGTMRLSRVETDHA